MKIFATNNRDQKKSKMIENDLKEKLKDLHQDSFTWALQCCAKNREDAQDVLQTVYLKILEGKAKFDGKSAFKTWLFSVIRFTSIDAFRKDKTRLQKISLTDSEGKITEKADEIEIQNDRADTEKLKTALDQLSERQREILILVFYQELSIADAAKITGLSLGTARTHYERGKENLKKILSQNR